MAHDIKDKSCLVTGGASGIGASCVEAFLREGAKFAAILDVAEEKGQALEEKLNKLYPGKVLFMKCDVSNEDSITAAFNAVVDKVKQLDVVVNNAGILNDSENFWRSSCEINLLGAISLTLKGVKHMRKDQGGAGGTIINVASIGAFVVSPASPIYCATKAAIVSFSRSLSGGPFYSMTGVRVLTICFGCTDTPILQGLSERAIDPSIAQALEDMVEGVQFQRPESAAAAFVAMIKNGANGSVWMSQNDKPAEDITATIDRGYDTLVSAFALKHK